MPRFGFNRFRNLATAGVSIKLSAPSSDDKSDSTSASRVLSSPQTSSTNLRRSSAFAAKPNQKLLSLFASSRRHIF
jgi:hypothetical protein